MENNSNKQTTTARYSGSISNEKFPLDLPLAFGALEFGANSRKDVVDVARYVAMQFPELSEMKRGTPSDFFYNLAMNPNLRKANLIINALVGIGMACEKQDIVWSEIREPETLGEAVQTALATAQKGSVQAVENPGRPGGGWWETNSAKAAQWLMSLPRARRFFQYVYGFGLGVCSL